MIRLDGDIDLVNNPELINAPKTDIVSIEAISDKEWVIKPNLIDVALSYSLAGLEVILEIPFARRKEFNLTRLAALVSNIGCSVSLLPPSSTQQKHLSSYSDYISIWYDLLRSQKMKAFEENVYPISNFIEYLTIEYLIITNKNIITKKEESRLRKVSKNPQHKYVEYLAKSVFDKKTTDFYKQELEKHIKTNDAFFYSDIDLTLKSSKKQR